MTGSCAARRGAEFTLRDDENVLVPESFWNLEKALARAHSFPWFGRPWTIYGRDGRPCYSHQYSKEDR